MKAIRSRPDMDEFAGKLVAFTIKMKNGHAIESLPNYYRFDNQVHYGYISESERDASKASTKGYLLHGVFDANDETNPCVIKVTDECIKKQEIIIRPIMRDERSVLEQKIANQEVVLGRLTTDHAMAIIVRHKQAPAGATTLPRAFLPQRQLHQQLQAANPPPPSTNRPPSPDPKDTPRAS